MPFLNRFLFASAKSILFQYIYFEEICCKSWCYKSEFGEFHKRHMTDNDE